MPAEGESEKYAWIVWPFLLAVLDFVFLLLSVVGIDAELGEFRGGVVSECLVPSLVAMVAWVKVVLAPVLLVAVEVPWSERVAPFFKDIHFSILRVRVGDNRTMEKRRKTESPEINLWKRRRNNRITKKKRTTTTRRRSIKGKTSPRERAIERQRRRLLKGLNSTVVVIIDAVKGIRTLRHRKKKRENNKKNDGGHSVSVSQTLTTDLSSSSITTVTQ